MQPVLVESRNTMVGDVINADTVALCCPSGFYRRIIGDTEFVVPNRYVNLEAKGLGAQGMVW